MSHRISLCVRSEFYLLNIFSDKTIQRCFSPASVSDLAFSMERAGEGRMLTRPGWGLSQVEGGLVGNVI